ncbi:hypothetical protein CHLRE_17g718650v5 [Chlamydomonas reinhardtii]|uniref:Uncharacterized protein n=1 Tax=Chlamydomonas reinhardtii TaxID=3055 RepID=A0A2K3CQ53_CHLRE|nr:uncharacterized protein CHLRE_17g718650v5 [Chlamydomonas reinhardtii]PNW70411.1 hypothetical protein CHLRE_17g718650v5 [Chlamydomonas reinhardtii]
MGEGGKRKSRQEDAPAPPSHRILTADELGLLKVSEVPAGDKWEETAAKQRWGAPDKAQGITRLQVHCPDWSSDRCLVAAARTSGRVTLHAGSDGGDVGSFRAAPPASTSGRSDTSTNAVQALRFTQAEGSHQLLISTATLGGHVSVHRCPLEAALATAAAGRVVQTWEETVRLQTIGDLQAMDVSSSGRYVAVGGEGHQLKVWDLEAAGKAAKASSSSSGAGADGADGAVAKAGEPLFAGKAGKPSRSGLQDLAHVTAVAFVPGQDDKQVLVGTAKHKLWLYDMRAGRKPQAELVWGEGRITTLQPQPDGSRIWVGNGRGHVEALDMRQAPAKISMGHALKGVAGSIRALALHPSEPLIASVSLDRHLRVHHSTKRSSLAKLYLKQALTGVAWLPPLPATPAEGAADEAEEARAAEEQAEDQEEEQDNGRGARGKGKHSSRDQAGARSKPQGNKKDSKRRKQ